MLAAQSSRLCVGVALLALMSPAGLLAAEPALKDLNGHFPFAVPESADAWQERAEQLRLQTRVALGLHPLPQTAEPTPTIHGRREMDGYSVEKVILESLPGFFVTGTLYRPPGDDADQTRPAVLYAHGHWNDGRFYRASDGEVRRLIATGAERFENAAINHMQAACVQLARMGCVVFQYDMIGYADSGQISFARAHRWGVNVDNPDDDPRPLLFSAAAEAYGQSVMGLQSINTLQAFEMLRRLPGVDPERIAITGASGGGTQSFIASAVEPRLAGSMPAVMVSTAMQGGCVCENACGLRVGTGNIELAALTAPRPLALTTADDWTKNLPADGFPELQQLYALVGKPKAVELFPAAHFPHNYNHVTRVNLYGWINRLFGLGMTEPILERDFELLLADDLTVWDDAHPEPAGGLDFERSLVAHWTKQIESSVKAETADDEAAKQAKQKVIAEGWKSLLGQIDAVPGDLAAAAEVKELSKADDDGAAKVTVLVQRRSPGEDAKPAAELTAAAEKQERGSTRLITISDPLADAYDTPDQAPLVANPRPAAAYTYGYNPPPPVRRLAVLLHALDQLGNDKESQLHLVAGDDEIFTAAAAAVLRPQAVASVTWVSATHDDPLRRADSIRHPDFVPNGLRYLGLEGLLTLCNERIHRQTP